MIDKMAFRNLSYGMYVITTTDGEKPLGCVANTFSQATSQPFQVTVALNKDNATTRALRESGRYVACCLSEDASMEYIGTFGFRSSTEVDKFAGLPTAVDAAGIAYVDAQFVSRFSVKVTGSLDMGTHILFLGEVEEAETAVGTPMTYAYYHEVKGGKTPPKASSYVPDDAAAGAPVASAACDAESAGGRIGWRCMLCGYVIEADELPEDFVCPLCGAGRDMFERIEL